MTTKLIRGHNKSIIFNMMKHTKYGTCRMGIFYFLARFVNEGNMLEMSEAHALLKLPTILHEPAEAKFRTNLSVTSRQGDINLLARGYPVLASYVRDVFIDVQSSRQNTQHLTRH